MKIINIMKYLKSYNFNKKFLQNTEDVEDILQELKDEGYTVHVTYKINDSPFFINVHIFKLGSRGKLFFPINDVVSEIQRLLDYMESNKFKCRVTVSMNPINAKKAELAGPVKGVQPFVIHGPFSWNEEVIRQDFIDKYDVNPRLLGIKINEVDIHFEKIIPTVNKTI